MRRWSMLGLGLLAGAVLQAPLQAQVRDTLPKKRDTTLTIPIPPRADSLLRDSLAKRDSILRARQRADTIKAPLAHAPPGSELSIARRLSWTRDSLAGTGAITVADLLERVPGLTTYHGGWISAPAVASYMGDVHRVRVYYDGFEMPALDPRTGGVLDLTQINLWSAEDAVVEQGPDEVRVYLRSWRVRNRNAETRTDVSTGDQQTNLYRGFYGRRFDNGTAFQFGAQQYGTAPPSAFGTSSDQTGIIGRVGWAGGAWSVDAFGTRIGRHRGSIFGESSLDITGDSIPHVESTRSDAYLRIGFRDPDTAAFWVQAMAVGSTYRYTGIRTANTTGLQTAQDSALAVASLDSSQFRSQYIGSIGSTRGALSIIATARLGATSGKSVLTPSLRAVYQTPRVSAIALAEGKSLDSTSHVDITARVMPLSFVALQGGFGHTSQKWPDGQWSIVNWQRGEAGIRVHGLWLLGGIVKRDSARIAPPRVFFDTTISPVRDGSASGVTAAIRGHLWRWVEADVWAVRWSDTTGLYRPRFQTRSELFVRTNLLNKFPTGNFGLNAAVVHEYRSGTTFPSQTAPSELVRTVGYRTISTLLEIRIVTATVSWQFRNTLGERYAQVPGFIMPRQTNFYGVRWYFAN